MTNRCQEQQYSKSVVNLLLQSKNQFSHSMMMMIIFFSFESFTKSTYKSQNCYADDTSGKKSVAIKWRMKIWWLLCPSSYCALYFWVEFCIFIYIQSWKLLLPCPPFIPLSMWIRVHRRYQSCPDTRARLPFIVHSSISIHIYSMSKCTWDMKRYMQKWI